MTITRYEASDDGYIARDGTSYTSNDYSLSGGVYRIHIYGRASSGTTEDRAYKRFIMDMGSVTITSATLHWYLHAIDPDDGCTTGCSLDQIADYGILDATSAEFTGTVKHAYGQVMAYDTATGWKSQDVSAEMEASKADAYVAFRWRITTIPTNSGDIDFYIGAYEDSTYKAYLEITYTAGWQHEVDSVAPAGVNKINGIARTTGIAKINGV